MKILLSVKCGKYKKIKNSRRSDIYNKKLFIFSIWDT